MAIVTRTTSGSSVRLMSEIVAIFDRAGVAACGVVITGGGGGFAAAALAGGDDWAAVVERGIAVFVADRSIDSSMSAACFANLLVGYCVVSAVHNRIAASRSVV